MKIEKITVFDPISGYPFLIESPYKISKRPIGFHPAYFEPFDKIYKQSKSILLDNETQYSLQVKHLSFGILLYKLSEIGLIEFKQFKSLKLSYGFFGNQELLAQFFSILPKLIFSSDRFKKQIPKFRITGNDLESFHYWIHRCLEIINKQERYRQDREYDEEFLKINTRYQRWKLYSNQKQKLPRQIIHYLHTICAFTPQQKQEWDIFFIESSGSLYLKNRSKSKEAFDLFWSLISLIDFIECNQYQNTLTFDVVKFLKAKMEEWVNWEPSFFDISLDYRLLAKKSEAWTNAKDQWALEAKEHKAQAEERLEKAKLAKARIEQRKQLKSNQSSTPISQFEILLPETNDDRKDT